MAQNVLQPCEIAWPFVFPDDTSIQLYTSLNLDSRMLQYGLVFVTADCSQRFKQAGMSTWVFVDADGKIALTRALLPAFLLFGNAWKYLLACLLY